LQRCEGDENTVANSRERRVLGIFVDFKGAFDNVEWSAVLDRLVDVGCREIDLLKSYFSGRSASIISCYEAVTVAVTRGCPQGSVSGPFIWNLLMNVLLQRLEPHCALSAFADDLLLFVDGNCRADLERKGEHIVGAEVVVSVLSRNTAIMLLKGQLSRTRRPTVRFAGASIPYVTKCRYPGILVLRENCLHILCECRLYHDLRDLDTLGVVRDQRRWIVARVVETPERVRLLVVLR